MDNEEGKTIHEELREAFSAQEEDTTEEVVDNSVDNTVEETPVEEKEPTSNRDEEGNPVSRETDDIKVEVKPEDLGKWTADRPPSSWTPKAREGWKDLPEGIREEIIRREEASAVGARKLQEQYKPVQQIAKDLEPYIKDAQSLGAHPSQFIAQTMNTERVLRTGDMPAKFKELLRVADSYGIPLRDVINKSVGQEVLAPQNSQPQMHPEVQQELKAMREWRQQSEFQQATNQVNTFGADKEFFNDVRQDMANLVERGLATDLNDAYEKAIWSNPQVREVLMGRHQQQTQQTNLATRQKAAAKVGVIPSGQVDVATEDEADDTYSMVRQAFQNAQSGRT